MYSAGVLLAMKQDGDIYFLLGRDAKYKTWSDFGGKHENVDKLSPRKTASREFFEESCGVIYDLLDTFGKLKHTSPLLCKSYMNNNYFMYVLKIDFDDQYVKKFNNIRRLLLMNKHTSHKYLEKDCLQWMTIDNIINNPKSFRCVFYKSFINNLDEIKKCVSI